MRFGDRPHPFVHRVFWIQYRVLWWAILQAFWGSWLRFPRGPCIMQGLPGHAVHVTRQSLHHAPFVLACRAKPHRHKHIRKREGIPKERTGQPVGPRV
eukprot:1501680-Prymnesium_polylepis.1